MARVELSDLHEREECAANVPHRPHATSPVAPHLLCPLLSTLVSPARLPRADGGQTCTLSYSYSRAWLPFPVSSANFKNATAVNPPASAWPVQPLTPRSPALRMGNFTLPPDLYVAVTNCDSPQCGADIPPARMPDPRSIPTLCGANSTFLVNGRCPWVRTTSNITGKMFYYNSPTGDLGAVGTVRVSFRYSTVQEVSVVSHFCCGHRIRRLFPRYPAASCTFLSHLGLMLARSKPRAVPRRLFPSVSLCRSRLSLGSSSAPDPILPRYRPQNTPQLGKQIGPFGGSSPTLLFPPPSPPAAAGSSAAGNAGNASRPAPPAPPPTALQPWEATFAPFQAEHADGACYLWEPSAYIILFNLSSIFFRLFCLPSLLSRLSRSFCRVCIAFKRLGSALADSLRRLCPYPCPFPAALKGSADMVAKEVAKNAASDWLIRILVRLLRSRQRKHKRPPGPLPHDHASLLLSRTNHAPTTHPQGFLLMWFGTAMIANPVRLAVSCVPAAADCCGDFLSWGISLSTCTVTLFLWCGLCAAAAETFEASYQYFALP